MASTSSPAARRTRAVQSFQSAAECIGPVRAGMGGLFAITRGQWSMIDAVLHCIDQLAPEPVRLSLWTWTVAEYEIQCIERLMLDKRIASAVLVIDHGARGKNKPLLDKWLSIFGKDSVRFVVNHSKIATIEAGNVRLLLRGSMNLNFNPRFEQFDLTEGGADFDMVREIESELPSLPIDCSSTEAYNASKVSGAFDQQTLSLFTKDLKPWAK